ncbi:hypothetical protein QE152_g34302 [Popillia japonica]|uniref:Copia protein n=1 Tax=Popillia japonica TaxID=7064 RepID=A0AAW1ITW9_POPJA
MSDCKPRKTPIDAITKLNIEDEKVLYDKPVREGTVNLELFYPNQIDNPSKLVEFADADWANDELQRKSTSGYVFKLFESTISWCSRKQSVTAMSSTEAEYVALSETSREGIWLLNLINELGFTQHHIILYENNQSCIKLTQKTEHKRLKHIDVKYNYIKDLVTNSLVKLEYVPSNDQIADILTKNLPLCKFEKLRDCLGLRITNSEESSD